MNRYSTRNGDQIRVIVEESKELSFSSDIEITAVGNHGNINSTNHEPELLKIFQSDIVFDIEIEPSGSNKTNRYDGCMLKSPTKWQSASPP